MSTQDDAMRYARALGRAQGGLDSIVVTGTSSIRNITDPDTLHERMSEMVNLAVDTLGAIQRLAPGIAGEIADPYMLMPCGHWMERHIHKTFVADCHYECSECGRSITVYPVGITDD